MRIWNCMAIAAGLHLVLMVSGCGTPGSRYISPRVEGRVMDAQTREPLKGVYVRKVQPGYQVRTGMPFKGSELMESSPAVRTRDDGTFKMASEKDLAVLNSSGWYSVTLSFELKNYTALVTNYTLGNVTSNAPNGEPVVVTGDILLNRAAKP